MSATLALMGNPPPDREQRVRDLMHTAGLVTSLISALGQAMDAGVTAVEGTQFIYLSEQLDAALNGLEEEGVA